MTRKVIMCAWFKTIPRRRRLKGKKAFVFDTRGRIIVSVEGNERLEFIIPKGFICDSTSWLWAFDNAGDFHDWAYAVQLEKLGYDRLFWDEVYYHLMINIGFSETQAKIRYWGVRLFGLHAFNQRREELQHALKIDSIASVIKEVGV